MKGEVDMPVVSRHPHTFVVEEGKPAINADWIITQTATLAKHRKDLHDAAVCDIETRIVELGKLGYSYKLVQDQPQDTPRKRKSPTCGVCGEYGHSRRKTCVAPVKESASV